MQIIQGAGNIKNGPYVRAAKSGPYSSGTLSGTLKNCPAYGNYLSKNCAGDQCKRNPTNEEALQICSEIKNNDKCKNAAKISCEDPENWVATFDKCPALRKHVLDQDKNKQLSIHVVIVITCCPLKVKIKIKIEIRFALRSRVLLSTGGGALICVDLKQNNKCKNDVNAQKIGAVKCNVIPEENFASRNDKIKVKTASGDKIKVKTKEGSK